MEQNGSSRNISPEASANNVTVNKMSVMPYDQVSKKKANKLSLIKLTAEEQRQYGMKRKLYVYAACHQFEVFLGSPAVLTAGGQPQTL